MLKVCATEEQRVQYTLLLRASAPPMVKRGDKGGMATKIAAWLEVPFGVHYRKGTKAMVKYAFTSAVSGRHMFTKEAAQARLPRKELKVGDTVLCRGHPAGNTDHI